MSYRILVVDDDRTTRDYLSGILEGPFQVAQAATGEEALALAGRQMPDIVLLDILMPGIDGCETCRRLKEIFAGHNIQVIMVTAATSQDEQLRAVAAGADAYMIKPIDPCVLMSEIRVHLRLREAIGQVKANELDILVHSWEIDRLVCDRYRHILAMQDLAVFALAKMAESVADDTGEHLTRVRSYSQILGHQLSQESPYADEVTPAFLANLYRSSPLHDIGKVGVSDTILLKPGPLSPEEFERVKLHTIIGANTLREVLDYAQSGGALAMGMAIARWHHERFDGRGYPDGLAGTAIPLAARIVALADVVDALTSRRPYKPAYSPAYARRIVSREAGKHFDPVIVAAYEARYAEFLAVYENSMERCRDADADGRPAAPPSQLLTTPS